MSNRHSLKSLSSFVSICSWNVGGLFSKTINKLKDTSFLTELLHHDIIFFSETHTGFDTSISLDGFQHFPICRPISLTNIYYGGLALFIKKYSKNTEKRKFWIPVDTIIKELFSVGKKYLHLFLIHFTLQLSKQVRYRFMWCYFYRH